MMASLRLGARPAGRAASTRRVCSSSSGQVASSAMRLLGSGRTAAVAQVRIDPHPSTNVTLEER